MTVEMPCASCSTSRTSVRRSQRNGLNRAPISSNSIAEPCDLQFQTDNNCSASSHTSHTRSSTCSTTTKVGAPMLKTLTSSIICGDNHSSVTADAASSESTHHPPYQLRRKGPCVISGPSPLTPASCSSTTYSLVLPSRKRPKQTQCDNIVPTEDISLVSHYFLDTLPDDVVLLIFGYLMEKELCQMSQVCKRFHIMANDTELWRKLYRSLYEYDLPLFNPEPCRFEFEKVTECEYSNPWKESFRQLYRGIHVRQNYQNISSGLRKIKFFNTIESALDYIDKNGGRLTTSNGDGPLVFIHAGTYTEEFIVIDCDVTLIGAAPGNVAKSVVLDRGSESTIMFVEGAKHAYAGHMTLKFSPGLVSVAPHHKHCSLEISENCSPVIDCCIIRSDSVVGAAVCVSGTGANPTIRNCDVSDCANVGLYVTDYAQGLYEDNEINNNALAGIKVKNGASPIMRRNHIHHGRDVGVLTFDNGMGYFEANDIHSNSNAGIEVKTGANPTVVNCEIHHGPKWGIYIHGSGRGQFMYNKIHSFNFAGVWITSHSNPTVRRNEIYNCKQGGVYIFEGRSLIEYNNIHGDALPGIQITTSGRPIVRHNNIHKNCEMGRIVSKISNSCN